MLVVKTIKGTTKMSGNAEKIIELDRQRMAAMAEKDVAKLDRIIADDLDRKAHV